MIENEILVRWVRAMKKKYAQRYDRFECNSPRIPTLLQYFSHSFFELSSNVDDSTARFLTIS